MEARAAASPLRLAYRDVEHAKAILVVGLDAEQELPILHLRIRKAIRRCEAGLPVANRIDPARGY